MNEQRKKLQIFIITTKDTKMYVYTTLHSQLKDVFSSILRQNFIYDYITFQFISQGNKWFTRSRNRYIERRRYRVITCFPM